MTRDEQLALVAEAARAPTVHNVQPALWRITDANTVILWQEPGRSLPVADPTNHDLHASMGAVWEGMAIALSAHGLALGVPQRDAAALAAAVPPEDPARARALPYAVATLARGATVDPNVAALATRRSWRGPFAAAPRDLQARLAALTNDDVIILTNDQDIATVAHWHDAATLGFMRGRPYFEELRHWLRLDVSAPAYRRDGLTADAMAMSPGLRMAARLVFRWPVMRGLRLLGMDGMLVSEAPQVRSAAALVLFTPLRTLDPFGVGRRFHRLWLALERVGLVGCPMSALADDPITRGQVTQRAQIPPAHRLANVLRVGVAATAPAESPRLPASERLI